MKKLLVIFFLGFSCICVSQNLSRETYLKIKKLTAPFPNQTQLSIGITDNGTRKFFGLKKMKDTLIPVNNKSLVFGIGSITKVFTALLVTDLIASKKISLSDDIKKFYPFKMGKSETVDIVSVLTHSSGLQRGPSNFSSPYTQKKLHAYLRGPMLINFDSTGHFRYSNLGFIILGDILNLVSGKTYLTLLKEKILVPFKMTATSTDPLAFKKGVIVMGRDTSGYQLKNHNFYGYQSAGALLSNAPDLLSFIEYNFVKSIPGFEKFKVAQKEYFRNNEKTGMGFGWQIHYPESDTVYMHSGAVAGYTSSLKYSKKHKRGVIVLSNLSGYGRWTDNIDYINEVFLNEE